VAKGISESAKNFKNISLTVSVRQQLRMASVYYNGMFEPEAYILPSKVTLKKEIPDDTEFHRSLKEFMKEEDIICNDIIVNSQQYVNGDIVVLDVEDNDTLKVGLVQSILVQSEKVYFVTKRFCAKRNSLGYFVTEDQGEERSSFVNSSHLKDYKPLIQHGTITKFKFSLHHHISFSHQ
jgi:hypothetical protein